MFEIHAEDVCNDTYGRVHVPGINSKRPDGIPIPSESVPFIESWKKSVSVIVLGVIRKEITKDHAGS